MQIYIFHRNVAMQDGKTWKTRILFCGRVICKGTIVWAIQEPYPLIHVHVLLDSFRSLSSSCSLLTPRSRCIRSLFPVLGEEIGRVSILNFEMRKTLSTCQGCGRWHTPSRCGYRYWWCVLSACPPDISFQLLVIDAHRDIAFHLQELVVAALVDMVFAEDVASVGLFLTAYPILLVAGLLAGVVLIVHE